MSVYYKTKLGKVYLDDSLRILKKLKDNSVDLIVTSPPFGLVRKKEYGNVDARNYVKWFKPFGVEFFRVLNPTGSFVLDIGGSWNKGKPTRSLYHYKLLIMLCEEIGFNLAQDLFWWNPAKLPTPAEWVTVRRIRVKDAINTVWWLSKTAYPKASNRRVLVPYSKSMLSLLKNGYKPKKRPSGHDISDKFSKNNRAAIPPNLIAIPNTESNSFYQTYCKEHNIKMHPARFPELLPEFFIRMLTDKKDLVIDPFAGSCVTGIVCEKLKRKWICIDLKEEYLKGALARFKNGKDSPEKTNREFYKVCNPSVLWQKFENIELPADGGQSR